MNKKLEIPMLVFVHIEKTAGTTLDYFLINNMFYYFGLQTFSVWSNDSNTLFTQNKFRLLKKIFPFIKGIGGHSVRSFLGYDSIEEVRYITFLRNPVDRYISHYKHQKYKMGIDWSIEDFLNETRFDNNMTKKLSSTGDLDKAIDNLYKLDFVGIQEEFDASLLIMKQILKLDGFVLDYEVKNVSVKKTSNKELTDKEIIKEIIKRNEKDLELYKHAMKIHQKNKSEYRGNLRLELKQMKLRLDKYKENKFKIILQKIIKLLLIRPVEFFINTK